MKRMNWLVIGLAIAGLSVGCGDDDTTGTPDTGGTDSGGIDGGDIDSGVRPPICPTDMGMPYQGRDMGACCSSASNASKQDAPEFRISALRLTTPTSLANDLVAGQLQDAIDFGTFNWLIQVADAGADGMLNVTTGFGRYTEAGNTYSFETGEFAPVSVTGTLTGETFTAEPLDETVILPIVDEETGEPTLSLPLQQLTLEMATMSADRDCIGERMGRMFDTNQATLRTYITVEDAKAADVMVSPINTTLCNVLRGALLAPAGEDCEETPRAMWTSQPDALCEAGTCTEGACDPLTTCNAWTLAGGVAAQAVEIN